MASAYLFYGFLGDGRWKEAHQRLEASGTRTVISRYGTHERPLYLLSERQILFTAEGSAPYTLEDAGGMSPLAVTGAYLRLVEGRMREHAERLGLDLSEQKPRWWLVSADVLRT